MLMLKIQIAGSPRRNRVEKDVKQSVQWYKKAATGGNQADDSVWRFFYEAAASESTAIYRKR